MASNRHKIATVLLAGSTLGSCGTAIHHQREMDRFILSEIDNSLADHSWQKDKEWGEKAIADEIAHMDRVEQQLKKVSAGIDITEQQITALDQEITAASKERKKHYGPPIQSIKDYALSSRAKHGIKSPFVFEVIRNNDINMQLIPNQERTRFLVTTGLLNSLSTPEKQFVIAHEVAGHLKREYTDADGNMRSEQFFNMEPFSRWKEINSGLPTIQYKQMFLEEQADRAATRDTCDPAAGVRLFAKLTAQQKQIPLAAMREEIAEGLTPTPSNMASALKERWGNRYYLTKDTHPHWKDRVRSVIEEAATHCATKTR